MQQAHRAVEKHRHVVIKLASDSDSSSDTDTALWNEGLHYFTVLSSNIWRINRNNKTEEK